MLFFVTSEEYLMTTSRLILCVDDEIVGLKVRRMLLERAGYRVLTALDGATGIEIFSREPVDAVVLDFSMPGMTGAEVATNMRRVKPEVPILMLSAYTSLPPEVSNLVDLYMTKGEGAPALLKKLGGLIAETAAQSF
jgi:CheY-like chemotaxis protein